MFLSAVSTSLIIHAFLGLHATSWDVLEKLRNRKNEKGLFTTLCGGILMGIGMAMTGACPGTVIIQMGTGVLSGFVVFTCGIIGGFLYTVVDEYHCLHSLYPVARLRRDHIDRYARCPYSSIALVFASLCIAIVALLLLEVVTPPTDQKPWPGSITAKSWSPIASGCIVGLLQLPMLLLTHRPIGASSTYVTLASNITYTLFPKAVSNNKPLLDAKDGIQNWWQPIYLLGAVCGAATSAALSGTWNWYASVHSTAIVTYLLCGLGGVLLVFGARLGGGCTSGHGISGVSQLSIRSMTMVVGMFAGGIASALALRALGAFNSLNL